MMNKLYLSAICLTALFGCNGFLDEVDRDKIIPTKTDHYTSLMLQECNADYAAFAGIHYMTDDIIEDISARSSKKDSYKTIFAWKREIEMDENGKRLSNNAAWESAYRDIAVVNYVLELIDEADGTPEEIAYTKGEAYFLRALNYFNLVNLYAEPFELSTHQSKLGVPLRLNIAMEQTYARNTLDETYEQIEQDLAAARTNIAQNGLIKTIWHPTLDACNLLMSRIKLYQNDWPATIEYASAVINNIPLNKMSATSPFVRSDNKEIIYSCQPGSNSVTIENMQNAGYCINPELVNLFDDNDLRRELCFKEENRPTGTFYYSQKSERHYTLLGQMNLRGAEAYLNRAEAYVMAGNLPAALSDVKAVAEKRYKDPALVVYPSEQEKLLEFILLERRKEFCLEDHHRWFDLRRMENRPKIKHAITLVNEMDVKTGRETYYLLPDDKNYTLSIPIKEREINPWIRNNERLEKIPEKDTEIIIP